MAKLFSTVDLLLVPSLREEMLIISNFTGHPSLTLRTGFVNVGEARSDWAPDPANPLPKFSPPRRVPHGVTLIGRLFDEGTIARAGLALERASGVVGERPPGFA
jgi:Asp-tRNA(Asn)/Glu-tRNA(Gln) amidotransferase A subunit family amidase